MLNLNVCKREGGNEGQDTRYWWYCWDLYAVGVFCIFLSADIITRKSWCNDIEAMAKVNILPQQVQTIGTFFCKKKGERLCFWELEISIISSCRSSRAALSFPPNARSRDFGHQLIPRVRRPPASFWFASSLNFLSNISLRSTWSGERVEDISTHHPDYLLWCHSLSVHSCFCQVNFCLPAGGMWWCT